MFMINYEARVFLRCIKHGEYQNERRKFDDHVSSDASVIRAGNFLARSRTRRSSSDRVRFVERGIDPRENVFIGEFDDK